MPAHSAHKLDFFRRHKIISGILIFIVVIFVFIFWPKPPKIPETLVAKKTDIIDTLSASGNIASLTSVDLNFMTGGKLSYLGVKKGDTVHAGQTIASLDQRTIQKNLETALRNYAEQRNTFDQTINNNNNHSPQDALTDAMKRILDNNQYDLEKAVLSVELQDLARDQAVLTTPISGVVVRADAQSSGINIGPTSIFTVADPANLVFQMDIDEADIGKVHAGQQVKISLDPFPDQTLDLIVGSIDFTTHTTSTGGDAYTVEVPLSGNNGMTYRIGMNGDADITLAEKKNVLTIPLTCITDDGYIYVKTGKTFTKRKAVTGIKNDTDAEIIAGVQENDLIALQPADAEKYNNLQKSSFHI